MINKVNGLNNVRMYSTPNFQAKEKEVSKFVENKGLDGKALANYSMASVDFKKKLKVEPLIPTIYLPEAVDAIKGERIYKSNGELYAIIDETDKTRTVFTPVEGSDNMFKTIISYDKKTGNVVREQLNEIEGREHKNIYIHQYSPETGKEVAFTKYGDDGLEFASKTTYNKDGSKSHVCYDYDEKRYHLSECSKDGNKQKNIYLTEDMKFITVDSSVKTANYKIDTREEYYNGSLLNSERKTSSTMTNMMGLDPMSNDDLAVEKIITREEVQALGESIEGEKTYFSNGKVESVKGKVDDLDIEVHFNPIGEVTNIISEKGEIIVDDYSISQSKIIDKDYKITSTDFKFGGSSITLEKDGKFIEAYYSDKGIISSYFEGEIEKDGEREYTLSLLYDENGMLVNAYND